MDMQDPVSPEEESEPALDGESVETPGSDLPQEAYNLVPMIMAMKTTPDGISGQEWLDKQARMIIDTTKEDEDGRQVFMDRRENQLKLYAGILKPLEYPSEGAKAP